MDSILKISPSILSANFSKLGDEILGNVSIQKLTRSLVFLTCKLKSNKKIIATASGVWKRTNKKFI